MAKLAVGPIEYQLAQCAFLPVCGIVPLLIIVFTQRHQ
jgi:hypothetical protein